MKAWVEQERRRTQGERSKIAEIICLVLANTGLCLSDIDAYVREYMRERGTSPLSAPSEQDSSAGQPIPSSSRTSIMPEADAQNESSTPSKRGTETREGMPDSASKRMKESGAEFIVLSSD